MTAVERVNVKEPGSGELESSWLAQWLLLSVSFLLQPPCKPRMDQPRKTYGNLPKRN